MSIPQLILVDDKVADGQQNYITTAPKAGYILTLQSAEDNRSLARDCGCLGAPA